MPDPGIARRAVLTAGLDIAILPLRQVLAVYPERLITWIVAYAARGGSDMLARLLAEVMAPMLVQFVDRAKIEPGTINDASPGIGSPHHLTREHLACEAVFGVRHVPYI